MPTKVKLVEYRWTVDASMDPYVRSGDEIEIRRALLIPGNDCPDVLVFISDKLIFREMSEERPGKSLLRDGIYSKEWEFAAIGEMEIDTELILAARQIAKARDLLVKTNSAFRAIFTKLDDES